MRRWWHCRPLRAGRCGAGRQAGRQAWPRQAWREARWARRWTRRHMGWRRVDEEDGWVGL
eukprot:scaffold37932_cov68-Phaeocystis_antarctica.AAC.5